jgi:hypothetical protein
MEPHRVQPAEAAQALVQVRSRQQQAIAAATVPDWFWGVMAVLVPVFTGSIESGRPEVIVTGSAAFGIGLLVTITVVVGRARAQIHNNLLGVRGGLTIAGFVLALVAVTQAVAVGLLELRVPYPATLSTLVTAGGLVMGGPWLMRRLRRIMSDRVAGGTR